MFGPSETTVEKPTPLCCAQSRMDAVSAPAYWETCLTFRNSYWARLSYVHQNPVRHGLVSDAKDYPWCSAAWYERITPLVMRKTIERFKSDRLKVADEYHPVLLEE